MRRPTSSGGTKASSIYPATVSSTSRSRSTTGASRGWFPFDITEERTGKAGRHAGHLHGKSGDQRADGGRAVQPAREINSPAREGTSCTLRGAARTGDDAATRSSRGAAAQRRSNEIVTPRIAATVASAMTKNVGRGQARMKCLPPVASAMLTYCADGSPRTRCSPSARCLSGQRWPVFDRNEGASSTGA